MPINSLALTHVDYRKRVYRAMKYISRHIDSELTLEEVASSAALSPFHFHRIFYAVLGETVADFTRRLRVELAANRLLAKPCRDISSIALEGGFSGSQNFAKAFKRRFGVTASEYRKDRPVLGPVSKRETPVDF